MTVKEALAQTQKKKAGLINKASVNYAETLLLPGENLKQQPLPIFIHAVINSRESL